MRSSNSKVLQIVSKRLEHQQSAANSPEMLGFVSKLLQGRKRGLQGDISFFLIPCAICFFLFLTLHMMGLKVIYICLTPQKIIWTDMVCPEMGYAASQHVHVHGGTCSNPLNFVFQFVARKPNGAIAAVGGAWKLVPHQLPICT